MFDRILVDEEEIIEKESIVFSLWFVVKRRKIFSMEHSIDQVVWQWAVHAVLDRWSAERWELHSAFEMSADNNAVEQHRNKIPEYPTTTWWSIDQTRKITKDYSKKKEWTDSLLLRELGNLWMFLVQSIDVARFIFIQFKHKGIYIRILFKYTKTYVLAKVIENSWYKDRSHCYKIRHWSHPYPLEKKRRGFGWWQEKKNRRTRPNE